MSKQPVYVENDPLVISVWDRAPDNDVTEWLVQYQALSHGWVDDLGNFFNDRSDVYKDIDELAAEYGWETSFETMGGNDNETDSTSEQHD